MVVIPVLWRKGVSAVNRALRLDLSGLDWNLWRLPYWYEQASRARSARPAGALDTPRNRDYKKPSLI